MAATLSARRSPAHLCLSRRLVSSSKATPSAFAPTAMAAAALGTGSIADRVISLLSAADHPAHLAQIHALLLSSGLHHSPFLASTFLLTAPRSHQLAHARQFFDESPHPNDPRLFNAVIRLHSYHNAFYYALRLYRQMLRSNIIPDGFTLPPVLKACGGLPSHAIGRAVHAQVLYLGFESDIFVQNGIISMYTKCRDIPCARAVFDMLSARNVVSWTSILSGCTQNGFPLEALNLYRRMRLESDVRPDFIILVSVLKAYTDVEDLEHGKSVHGLVIKGGFEDEPDLNMTLTAMYAKCGQVLVAKLLFDRAKSMDVIMWNTMISGYAKNGHASEAIDLFKEMISRRVKPDSIALRSAILACAQVGSLEIARQMENYTNDSEFKDDVFVKTALIDMYAKCGSIDQAHAIFMRILDKDVVVWSAMITGYGLHGRGHEAMRLFNEMKHAGVRPNDVTFVGLLSACNHAGLVEEGWNYFHSMKDYGIEPQHQHYACVVDLLSRAGKLEKAYEFVRSMPIEPRLTVWGALLNACKIYGHVKLGEYVAEHVFALEPSNAGHYVKLSNIYASIGMWSEVAKVRVLMKERGVTKAIGCSMIDIKGELHSFRAGDKSHPRSKEIFVMLSELESKSHPSFSYKELYEITNGFAHQNILGEGGFGSVYKGCLSDGREVAVKRLKLGSGQGDREFKAEVEIISRVHHRHLVSLVGYCISDNQRLLVYDYVSNGTLESHLHGEGRPVMDWATRVKVAAGATRGIAYLHEDCHPRIIHRDIKSSNILLDNNFEAQVSDFGLARLAMDACTHVTTRVMGTFGYMAPEYASSGKLTEKSDVFSFGVVLLELITGRKPVDSTRPLGDESLVEWARPLLSRTFETGEFGELIDHRLGKNYNKTEMLRMIEAAAACTRHSASMRPQMGKVVRVLESLADIDLSNGITPGQSEVFNVAHSADIRIFQQLAFGNRGLSSDYSHSNWSHQTDM